MESKSGNAFVNLQLDLGQAQGPHHAGRHRSGGPARQRRRAKREAERQAAEQAVMNEKATMKADAGKCVSEEAEKVVTEVEVAKSNSEHEIDTSEKDVSPAENAVTDFKCEICDFSSNWKNGLEIHMSRKHSV